MNNKMLGTLALIGAPSMTIGLWLEEGYLSHLPWWKGAWGLLYLTGFMASMLAFIRMEVAGTSRLAWLIPRLMLVTLTIGNLSNIWLMVAPDYKPTLYFVLDLAGWPLSHLQMLVFGILVAKAGPLTGWKRYVPLFCGFWLPLAMISKLWLFQFSFVFGGVYNALAWTLLALVVLTSQPSRVPAFSLEVSR